MSKSTIYHGLDWQRRNYPFLDLEAAVSKLRENESSLFPEPVVGGAVPVTRFDMIRLEATSPCQDSDTFETADVGNGTVWQFWGVFDGHVGWQTSTILSQSLVSYVVRELKGVFTDESSAKDNLTIDNAIKRAFVRLDDDIILGGLKSLDNESATRSEVIADITPCIHGSMAVLAAYDPATSTLRVASVGDSSAVLGRREDNPKTNGAQWEAVPLAVSHSISANVAERDAFLAAHPDEPNLIVKGRPLGMPVTRAFGDHRWKWAAEALDKASAKFYSPEKREHYISPPYLHAEPEITSTVIRSGDFVVLACDGLWDNMSHDNAVKCLGQWVNETNRRVTTGAAPLEGTPGPEFAESVRIEGIGDLDTQIGQAWGWTARPEDFVVEDGNAATHLTRNALGGKRRDQFITVMTVLPPATYDARDDITVQVLFFGDAVKGVPVSQ